MVIDSSAIIAIMLQEPGSDELFEQMLRAPVKQMSAFTLLEASVVCYGRTRSLEAVETLRNLVLQDLRVQIVPFGEDSVEEAFHYFARCGKGIAPPGLNIGDCVVAAQASRTGSAVMSTSEEFARAGLRRTPGQLRKRV